MVFGIGKKPDVEQGTAIWIDQVGAISPRVFHILKREKRPEKGKILEIATISFGPQESYNIRADYIRAKRCIIYKLPDGEIKVQNPNEWRKVNLNKKGIKALRFNLQNMGLQEAKAAVRRWTPPETLVKKLMPLFKLLIIGVVIGVVVYVSWKAGTTIFNSVVGARLENCNNIIPMIVNLTK